MKAITLLAFGALIFFTCGARDSFEEQLVKSGYIHSPLPVDTLNSLDSYAKSKKVVAERRADVRGCWSYSGPGRMSETATGAAMHYNTSTGKRARGPENDPDYATYGHSTLRLDLKGVNLEEYNRIVFDVRPTAPGMRVTNINLGFENSREVPRKAGFNQPTGGHQIHLRNGRTNTCMFEIADLQRDAVEGLSFSATLNGRDRTTGDEATFAIENIRFQQVENPDKVSGWQPDKHSIIYSMTGYAGSGRKTAIANASHAGERFTLVNTATGNIAAELTAKAVKTTTGEYAEIDFSEVSTPGYYVLSNGRESTREFAIGEAEIWDAARWKVLNYIFGQRCGYDVPGIHSTCHSDLKSVHNGQSIPFNGGWHDAGDLSQQTLQTADVAFNLLEAYNSSKERNPLLAARLLEEARWGLDFELKNRYGDGYRASSMGLLIWQDGIHESFDDIQSVRVQNVPFDNYLHAGYEAYASVALAESDPCLAEHLRKVAAEDYAFAERDFAEQGYGGYINPYEHSYNTSKSQFHATMSWAASQLYRATGERCYAELAAEKIGYMLECQQTEALKGGDGMRGFFYRDTERKSIVHYIHQSREQFYMLALSELCRTQPEHPDRAKWETGMRLYGEYLKSLMPYTAPYGMIPGGIYADDEYEDEAGFFALHLFPPENARELYSEQIRGGEQIGKHHYIKRFPVWFNVFNGNLAIHTSMGKAAAVVGNYFGDDELCDIAREQLYWIVGKNPFAQSLIYGEGHNFPQLNSFSSGEITGSMPVGIRTLGNSDEPYWPQVNNACYKEVWVTSAGKWLSLLSEL